MPGYEVKHGGWHSKNNRKSDKTEKLTNFHTKKSNFPPIPNSRPPLNHHTQSDDLDIALTLEDSRLGKCYSF